MAIMQGILQGSTGGPSVTDPSITPTGLIGPADTFIDLSIDNTGITHPSAAVVSLGGVDPAQFDLPVDTLIEVGPGLSTTVRVSRAIPPGGDLAGTSVVNWNLSSGNTIQSAITADVKAAGSNRWLEVRLQFDNNAYQGFDSALVELRSDVTNSIQTMAATVNPTAVGNYTAHTAYGALVKGTTYPAPAIAIDPPSLMEITPPDGAPSGGGLGVWQELSASPSTHTATIMERSTNPVDIVAFFGPVPVGAGYSIAVREDSNVIVAFPGDTNVCISVRVWDVDPLLTWTTGNPPPDGAVPAGVLATGTNPMITTPPATASFPGAFNGQPNLGGNGSGAVANGWSLYGLPSDWTGSSQIAWDGVFNPVFPEKARIYHVDPAHLPAPHPGVAGTFEIL